MKSIKFMLSGIMLALISAVFVSADGGRGEFGGFALIVLGMGIILFIIGLLCDRGNRSDKFKK